MENFVYYNDLFDIYNQLLTDNERSTFQEYYQEDLSLSEIAEDKDISRSAVQKTIKGVQEKLDKYESILKIYEKNKRICNVIDKLTDKEIKSELEDIIK
jgi:hypothetical protein